MGTPFSNGVEKLDHVESHELVEELMEELGLLINPRPYYREVKFLYREDGRWTCMASGRGAYSSDGELSMAGAMLNFIKEYKSADHRWGSEPRRWNLFEWLAGLIPGGSDE